MLTLFSGQGSARLHLRRHGAGLPGGAGRRVQAADRGQLVRHDRVMIIMMIIMMMIVMMS